MLFLDSQCVDTSLEEEDLEKENGKALVITFSFQPIQLGIQFKTYVLLITYFLHIDLQTWKLTMDGKLINKHLQNEWLYYNKTWSFEPYDTTSKPGLSPSAFYIIQHNLADSMYK